MRYTVQLSTGNLSHQEYDSQDIIQRLSQVFNLISVDKVMLGWLPNQDMYLRLKDFLSKHGTNMILWLPVFSDTAEFGTVDKAVNLWGKDISSSLVQSGETFDFCCPSSPDNIDLVKEMYQKYFSTSGFDGIFMDRIRTHSFGGGISGVLSCGCPRCAEKHWENGVSLDDVRKAYETLGDNFFDKLPNGSFAHEITENFFNSKCKIIDQGVGELCNHFKSLGLEVGLDTFAPLMSRFVGQDYNLLTQHADFVKPMFYRRTLAPAGLGYEYDLLRSAAPNAKGYDPIDMDADFLNAQLRELSSLPCNLYAGIEINQHPELVKTSPQYVRECLDVIGQNNCTGAALSWNIMQAPLSHIEVLSSR